MRIAEVVGSVTLNRCHPSFESANLKLVIPLTLEDIARGEARGDEPLVAWDQLGAGLGARIALSEGPEAANPFRPERKPVEACVAAILDNLNLEESLVRSLVNLDGEGDGDADE
ncbi:MAG: EutN/CcmL family microcompartment protein [Planctomycetota bacterium]